MIDFACRWPNGSMKHTNGRTRQIAFCPSCQFQHKEPGCIFVPTHKAQAFGRNASAKPTSRAGTGAGKTNNLTGGRWKPEDILERIVEYYERSGDWPANTTAFRDSQSLPHSSTVKRHFPGGIAEAVAEAKELREKEIAERDWQQPKILHVADL